LSAIVSHETNAITKWKICNTAKYITLAAFAVKAVACVIIIILMYPLTESTPENEILSEQSFKLKKTEPSTMFIEKELKAGTVNDVAITIEINPHILNQQLEFVCPAKISFQN
jgi:hypothetical protein